MAYFPLNLTCLCIGVSRVIREPFQIDGSRDSRYPIISRNEKI